MTEIISIVNQKGGVGKTTSSISIASILGKKGYKTLLVDFDPQGNTTSGVGLYKDNFKYSIYDALFETVETSKAVYPTSVSNLYILPATKDLAGAEVELVNEVARETFLKSCLDGLDGSFDYVVIDCPPSLGLLTINALTASTSALIPVQSEYYALEGLAGLVDTINMVKKRLNPALVIKGIIITMFDKRNSLSKQVEAEARKFFKDKVYTTIIPRNVKLSEAPSFGEPIIVYDKKSKGSKAYKSLVKEMLNG